MTLNSNEPPPATRLRDRALRSATWTLAAHGFDLSVSLLSNLIMTRLLFPAAFGLVAAATAPIAGLALISDFGVHAIIVQSPRGEDPSFLRSAWAFQLWRGIIIWTILATICVVMAVPAIHSWLPTSSVYADRSFPLLAAVMGLGLVIGGAESTTIFLNFRRLNQKPIILLGMATRMFQLPIMVILAFVSSSVWALVAGGLAGSLLRLLLSHVMVPGPQMALEWDNEHIQEIIRFGKWILLSSLATFVVSQSDVIFFGFALPSSVIGIYSIAKLLLNAAEGILERLNSALALPIFGEIVRKDARNVRDRYYRFRLPIDLASALFSGMLLITGNLIVSILYDVRYSEAGAMLQFLAIGVALYPFQLIRSAFTATGDPQLVAVVTIVQAVSLILCMTLGFYLFGMFGAIFGIAIHRVFPSLLIILFAKQRDWISGTRELRVIPLFILGVLIGEGLLFVANVIGIAEPAHH